MSIVLYCVDYLTVLKALCVSFGLEQGHQASAFCPGRTVSCCSTKYMLPDILAIAAQHLRWQQLRGRKVQWVGPMIQWNFALTTLLKQQISPALYMLCACTNWLQLHDAVCTRHLSSAIWVKVACIQHFIEQNCTVCVSFTVYIRCRQVSMQVYKEYRQPGDANMIKLCNSGPCTSLTGPTSRCRFVLMFIWLLSRGRTSGVRTCLMFSTSSKWF